MINVFKVAKHTDGWIKSNWSILGDIWLAK